MAFRVFGDHAAVERTYAVAVFLLTALAICRRWRRFQPKELDWLPLFFWLLPSIVTWGVANNMLEVTQTLFTTLSVLLLVHAIEHPRTPSAVFAAVAAGLAVGAGVLTKGPVGLFPLASAVTISVVMTRRPGGRVLLVSAAAVLTVALIFAALLSYPPARESLSGYWDRQVVASLSGQREVTGDDWAFLRHLLLGIVGRMALVVCVVAVAAPRSGRPGTSWQVATMFAAVALTASVPLALSPKLVGHYFLPSTPFFALAAASLAAPAVTAIMRGRSVLVTAVPVGLAILLVAASVFVVGTQGSLDRRDVDLLRDLDGVGKHLSYGSTVGGCESEEVDWRLHSYLSRMFGVTLTLDGRASGGRFLQSFEACQVPAECTLAVKGRSVSLFRCEAGGQSDTRDVTPSGDIRMLAWLGTTSAIARPPGSAETFRPR